MLNIVFVLVILSSKYSLTMYASLSDTTTENEKHTNTLVTSMHRRQTRQSEKIETEEECTTRYIYSMVFASC